MTLLYLPTIQLGQVHVMEKVSIEPRSHGARPDLGNFLFKELALCADFFYKLKCPSVCECICSLLRYCLIVFSPHFPKLDVQHF